MSTITDPLIVAKLRSMANDLEGEAQTLANYVSYIRSVAPPPVDLSARFGPTFVQLNPGSPDSRPSLFETPHTPKKYADTFGRVDPWEVGDEQRFDQDYYSSSGLVGYDPDDPNDVGLSRIQTVAHYRNVWALSPRPDFSAGPAPTYTDPYNIYENRYKAARGLVAAVRNAASLSNEALVIWSSGHLTASGTQTSRDPDGSWPLPVLQFPVNKQLSDIALTTSNELAIISLTDTSSGKGQLAIVFNEAKWLAFHTFPYLGLPNQGSWSDFKLIGYIDLPFASPDHVAAASNGFWNGPSQTANQTLGQIQFATEDQVSGLREGEYGWQGVIAKGGYAIVSSKFENRTCIVDLSPVFQYIRASYLGSLKSFQQTVADRASGAWPVSRDNWCPVVWQGTYTRPTALLASQVVDRWSSDLHKAYLATEDGSIHVLDTSSLMNRYDWQAGGGPIKELFAFGCGKNPTSLAFTRFGGANVPNIPSATAADPVGNDFFICCRGSRRIDVASAHALVGGSVYSTIDTTHLVDPVHISVVDRAPVLNVADYNGHKVHAFRFGGLVSMMDQKLWLPGSITDESTAWVEYNGSWPVPGRPFVVNSANVN